MNVHREYNGSFPATDLFSAACRLAGALAESGFIELQLITSGQPPRSLPARETDLPGELLRILNPPGIHAGFTIAVALRDPAGTLFLELHRSQTFILWRTNIQTIATAIGLNSP